MTLGEPIGDIILVKVGETADIKPPDGEAWMIFNIVIPSGASFEIYYSDGVNDILVDSITSSIIAVRFVALSHHFIRVKNTSTVDQYIGYNGIKLI